MLLGVLIVKQRLVIHCQVRDGEVDLSCGLCVTSRQHLRDLRSLSLKHGAQVLTLELQSERPRQCTIQPSLM